MSTAKRACGMCILLPIALIGSCTAKMAYSHWRYDLPGKILESSTQPTRQLKTTMEVAEALDEYVQPRFAIVVDRGFGLERIVYRKHAGIVQLKVDSPKEHELIANVNAAHRDYAICMFHCTQVTKYGNGYANNPVLEMLYLNQKQIKTAEEVVSDRFWSHGPDNRNDLDQDVIEEQCVNALPNLMRNREHHTQYKSWDIFMCPVVITNRTCLSCHTPMKLGQTLSVMVYAISRTKNDVLSKLVTK